MTTVKHKKTAKAETEKKSKKLKVEAPLQTKKLVVDSIEGGTRKRKLTRYKSFRLQKKIPHPAGTIPSGRRILIKSWRLLWANKKPLLLLFLIYAVLNLIFVRNFTSPLDVRDVKKSISSVLGIETTAATQSSSDIFSLLSGTSSDTTSGSSGIYQTILMLMMSIALIWIFRQYAAGNKPTARMALYKGMYPIVPFVLVLLVMAVQLVPAALGGTIYSIVRSGDLAISGFENGLWLLFFGLTIVLSLYMLCSSVFALYIVTLPEMTPLKALRSARQLVISRRMNILRKMLIVPLLVIIVLMIIVVPALYFMGSVAPWLYFSLTLLSVVFLHAYLFTIYRELL